MQRSAHNISTSIANRMAIFENKDDDSHSIGSSSTSETVDEHRRTTNTMMSMSSSQVPPPPPPAPPGVQTDERGLILPKKLFNPCLESTDRKELHRELKFNNRIGKSVLNQKTELQRAYEKQRERHAAQEQQQHSPIADSAGGISGLRSELSRVIMERAQKHEAAQKHQDADADDERQYVNPEYLNVRAKLRTAHTPN